MSRRLASSFALVARGVLLATAFWAGLVAWWVDQNAPGGSASAMYAYIRVFYGCASLSGVSLALSVLTFGGPWSRSAAA